MESVYNKLFVFGLSKYLSISNVKVGMFVLYDPRQFRHTRALPFEEMLGDEDDGVVVLGWGWGAHLHLLPPCARALSPPATSINCDVTVTEYSQDFE